MLVIRHLYDIGRTACIELKVNYCGPLSRYSSKMVNKNIHSAVINNKLYSWKDKYGNITSKYGIQNNHVLQLCKQTLQHASSMTTCEQHVDLITNHYDL